MKVLPNRWRNLDEKWDAYIKQMNTIFNNLDYKIY